MYQRRCDLLAPIVDQINPQHYVVQTRQLHYELGECFTMVQDIRIRQGNESGDVSHFSRANKALRLIPCPPKVSSSLYILLSGLMAAKHFTEFLKTFKYYQDPKVAAEESYVDSYLMARLHLGRMLRTLHTPP